MRIVLTVLVGATVLNCGGEAPRSRVSLRDSAGIRIVESIAPTWQPNTGWFVDSAPVLDLATSGNGTAHEFFGVVDATRMADGSVAVAERGSNQIRLFSATGQFLLSIGRAGDGPGEFRLLASVDRFGVDSLIAFDTRSGCLAIVSLDGTSIRVIPPYSRDVSLSNVYPLTDSSLVAVIRDARSQRADGVISRPPRHVVRLSANTGMLIDTIAAFLATETFAFTAETFVGGIPPLFGKTSSVAVAQEHVLIGIADSLEYRVFSRDGRLERIVRAPGYALELSPAQVSEERAARLAEVNEIPPLRDAVERLPDPITRPAYSELLVDAEGHVWLAEHHGFTETDQPTDWEVFAESGEWLGSVRTPPRFAVYEIGADYVLGRWQDDLDVEHVQVLHLNRR